MVTKKETAPGTRTETYMTVVKETINYNAKVVNNSDKSKSLGEDLFNSECYNKLPICQKKVFDCIFFGGGVSKSDISAKTKVCDPGGHIRDLRCKGFAIADEWITTDNGIRYKRYFLKKGGC
jgi:hypothetical protein